jgi:hypothetical protein
MTHSGTVSLNRLLDFLSRVHLSTVNRFQHSGKSQQVPNNAVPVLKPDTESDRKRFQTLEEEIIVRMAEEHPTIFIT